MDVEMFYTYWDLMEYDVGSLALIVGRDAGTRKKAQGIQSWIQNGHRGWVA